ncbi:hypothetical protein N9207_00455 [bacterium]|nr:hypothetical protein [bacterium]
MTTLKHLTRDRTLTTGAFAIVDMVPKEKAEALVDRHPHLWAPARGDLQVGDGKRSKSVYVVLREAIAGCGD